MRGRFFLLALVLLLAMSPVIAEDKVIDIPTRSGVTQRFLLIPAPDAKAAVVLFAGGHGGLQLDQAGNARWGNNNFLVRSARLFASHDLTVAVIDAPSD
ncbi:MAG: alpha/beta hydrolase, partial [Burkholderiales bacterium]